MARITQPKNFTVKYMLRKNIDGLLFDSFSIAETFEKYYSSLTKNLVLNLPKPQNNSGMESVNNYHKKYNLKEK